MKTLKTVFDLACGNTLPAEQDTPARRTQLSIIALGSALVMAALWGLAAGSSAPSLMLHNAYTLPLIIILTGLGALPAALLAWKIARVEKPARELLHGYASSVFLGTAVMLVLAPLIALYYHSSAAVGPMLAMASVTLAVIAGSVAFYRSVRGSLGDEPSRRALIPAIVLVIGYGATLLQLIAIFAPILPEHTIFRAGIDAIGG